MAKFPTATQLGLHDFLPTLITPGQPWREWGIIEHLFHLADPDLYTLLYENYGHVTQGPRRYSVSSYLARRMSDVATRGAIAFVNGRGTGRWDYNTSISYWATTPTPDRANRLTWEQYATDNQLHGHWWEIVGRDRP